MFNVVSAYNLEKAEKKLLVEHTYYLETKSPVHLL